MMQLVDCQKSHVISAFFMFADMLNLCIAYFLLDAANARLRPNGALETFNCSDATLERANHKLAEICFSIFINFCLKIVNDFTCSRTCLIYALRIFFLMPLMLGYVQMAH